MAHAGRQSERRKFAGDERPTVSSQAGKHLQRRLLGVKIKSLSSVICASTVCYYTSLPSSFPSLPSSFSSAAPPPPPPPPRRRHCCCCCYYHATINIVPPRKLDYYCISVKCLSDVKCRGGRITRTSFFDIYKITRINKLQVFDVRSSCRFRRTREREGGREGVAEREKEDDVVI